MKIFGRNRRAGWVLDPDWIGVAGKQIRNALGGVVEVWAERTKGRELNKVGL